MLKAYWIPTAIFYILPSIFLLIAAKEQNNLLSTIVWLVPVPCVLFSMGALIAPYFGPKILERKYLSFVMAIICQLFSILIFIISQSILSGKIDSFSLSFSFSVLLPVFFFYSLLPALLGGLIFIFICEKINTGH